jgi:hypothetical protein
LQQEVRATMREWAAEIFDGRYRLDNRGAQPFAVLSYCRMLHTLATGRIELKPAAVSWATGVLDHPWQALIVHAWSKRLDPAGTIRQAADPDEVAQTLALSITRSHLPKGMGRVRPQHSRPVDGR